MEMDISGGEFGTDVAETRSGKTIVDTPPQALGGFYDFIGFKTAVTVNLVARILIMHGCSV